MSGLNEFTDSTDWLQTPLAALAPIESSLRCQVCKDFYTTPMITSCSHTFCSLCIRRYLSQEGQCPTCRKADQEIKLRRNWVVEELVTHFQNGREDMLKIARSAGNDESQQDEVERPAKRRRLDGATHLPERRSTRNRSKMIVVDEDKVSSPIQDTVPASDGESEYQSGTEQAESHDGLVACPVCNRRVKVATINAHVDACLRGEASSASPRRQKAETPQTLKAPTRVLEAKPNSREPLPTINYALNTENALRKKLRELGIPFHGSKEQMRKRHVEWMNLWNASCDAQDPSSKRQLLEDLKTWERTQGRPDRGPTGVMVKDFDRDAYQQSHTSDFADLIKKARQNCKAAPSGSANAGTNDEMVDSVQEGDIATQDGMSGLEQGTASLEPVFPAPSAETRDSPAKVDASTKVVPPVEALTNGDPREIQSTS